MFMLAEGDSAYLPKSGFDAVYPWHMFQTMIKVASGKSTALSIDSTMAFRGAMYPTGTIQMYFTSNHDENSWNQSDYGKFPGSVHEPFAVFTQTMADGVPLIYISLYSLLGSGLSELKDEQNSYLIWFS